VKSVVEIRNRVAPTSSVIDVTKFNSPRGWLGGETYIKLRLKAHITRDVTLPHLGNGATKVRSTFWARCSIIHHPLKPPMEGTRKGN